MSFQERHIKRDTEKTIERGWRFLKSEHQNGHFPSSVGTSRAMTRSQISPREIFSTLVVADTVLKNKPDERITQSVLHYLEQQKRKGLFTFFEDGSIYPPDTDTNALGYSLLLETGRATKQETYRVFDSILRYQDENGLIQVWLSQDRSNRTDPVVSANALYLAYLLGRNNEVTKTES